MSEMRELLEKWAELEPERCRAKKEIDGFTIKSDRSWDLILVNSIPLRESGLMQIQWVIQQAIVARGWYINMFYHYEEWRAETGPKVPAASFSKANNPAEALLTAYLQALEATL